MKTLFFATLSAGTSVFATAIQLISVRGYVQDAWITPFINGFTIFIVPVIMFSYDVLG